MKRGSKTRGRRGNRMFMFKRSDHRRASDEILRRLSANLRRLRTERGYTQQKLAKIATVNVRRMRTAERLHAAARGDSYRNRGGIAWMNAGYISRVEHARVNISLEALEALQRSLKCTVRDLLAHPDQHARPEVRR